MPTLGIGANIGVGSFEILYQKPYPDGLGYSYNGIYDHNFNAIISFNLGFS